MPIQRINQPQLDLLAEQTRDLMVGLVLRNVSSDFHGETTVTVKWQAGRPDHIRGSMTQAGKPVSLRPLSSGHDSADLGEP
jgi:hypothetical protein